MNKHGYIPSYGGYGNLPQYGLGSWLKENSKAVMGGLTTAAGIGLSFTGLGAGIGVPMAAAGLSQMGAGISEKNQMDNQMDAADEQRAFQIGQYEDQQAMMQQQQDASNRNNLINSRLQGLQSQAQPQYTTNFAANGGFLQSYANGGQMFQPNRNNPQPYKTSDGKDYYVMNYNEAFANDPNVKDFTEGYSYTSDPSYAYKYGAMSPRLDLNKGTASFPSTYSGNSDAFKSAFMNKYSSDDLSKLPSVNTRRTNGQLKNGGSFDEVDKNQDVTYFANGGTHEQNPLGGIPIGDKGSVEEGELKTKLKDGEYIFSNRF